jgi:23S rRNA (guanosine2251-2'-O)-methyltransferase
VRIYGINPILEALHAGQVEQVFVGARQLGLPDARVPERLDLERLTVSNARLRALIALATERGVPVEVVGGRQLERAARGGVHQGVVATVRDVQAFGPVDLVKVSKWPALIVVLDEVEDPHNVGAILRTADAAGASGLVRQARRSAALDGVVAKTSAGALAHVRIATVVNIARALDELKAQGVWAVGLADDVPKPYDEIDLAMPTAIVLGAEGTGLRRLVRERCDWLVSIPMRGHVSSLNVSVAAGIVLFEAARQRRRAGLMDPPPR